MAEITVVYQDKTSTIVPWETGADDLWLSLPDLARTSGWEIKPEGVCQEDICIPMPPDRSQLVHGAGADARFNLAQFARLIEQPFAHDDEHEVWYFGDPSWQWKSRHMSIAAPPFSLPDFQGRLHSLSDYRGKKVFLVAWASW